MAMIIDRRQFLQWALASAAALGLSQTDILKIQEALAQTPLCTCSDYSPATYPVAHPVPHVIWFQGQSCGGCTLSILNRMPVSDDPVKIDAAGNVSYGAVVQDIVDLLIGDAVGALTTGRRTTPGLGWAEFPKGYIHLDYQTEVMASTGLDPDPGTGQDIATYIECLEATKPFVLAVSGAIPMRDMQLVGSASYQPICVSGSFDTQGRSVNGLNGRRERSIVEVIEWLGTSTNCLAIIAFGSCASWGGIPGAHGNLSWSSGVYSYLVKARKYDGGTYPPGTLPLGKSSPFYPDLDHPGQNPDLRSKIINCPGCAPHPDWMIYPAAYYIVNGALPALDNSIVNLKVWEGTTLRATLAIPKNTPRAIYTGDKGYTTFCEVCSKYSTTNLCTDLGAGIGDGTYAHQKEYCTRYQGCNGFMASPDCPTRTWNNFDNNTHNQWCVGQRWMIGGHTVHTGANYVCQGCAESDFPDGRSPFFESVHGYPW
jgi:Ni,Fe-hydrogenase I small subunit